MSNICDSCVYWVFDEEDEDYACCMEFDEDEVYRFYAAGGAECPYYRADDEYGVVRHQM